MAAGQLAQGAPRRAGRHRRAVGAIGGGHAGAAVAGARVQAFAAAHPELPDGRIVFVGVPSVAGAVARMRGQLPGDPHARFPGSYVFVTRYPARVLAVRDVRRAGAGSTIASWIRTLHDGSVGGLATRILAVVLGMVPALLFATGTPPFFGRAGRARSAACRCEIAPVFRPGLSDRRAGGIRRPARWR